MWTKNDVMSKFVARFSCGGKFSGGFLIPDFSNRGRNDYFGGFVLLFNALNSVENWFTSEKHAIATTIRGVVDRFMRAKTKFTEVDKIKLYQAFIYRLPHHRSVKVWFQGLFKKSNNREFNFWHGLFPSVDEVPATPC